MSAVKSSNVLSSNQITDHFQQQTAKSSGPLTSSVGNIVDTLKTSQPEFVTKAQADFRSKCLSHWFFEVEGNSKELDGLLSDLHLKRETTSQEDIFDKKSHETMTILKKVIKNLKPREQADREISSRDNAIMTIKNNQKRTDAEDGASARAAKSTEYLTAEDTYRTGGRIKLESLPYAHLMVKNVLKEANKEFSQKMKQVELLPNSYSRILEMMELTKTYLSHLDRRKGIAELMPFELFIENYLEELDLIVGKIKE